ncbi:unnamed protein product [Orchesella dallaii]|uniref:Nucleolar protein 12 n=1 Tax=Orchesella dallaii TaxID=48710 RepID=A0ABP1QKN1_9HEXA
MDFNFEEDEAPPEQKKGPKKRFRKNKLKLTFDIEERKKFLLGFRKRKQERKEKYIEKLERDLVKEKKRIRQQTERATKKLSNSHAVLPEVQSIIDNMPERTETYDLGKTLVSITSLDDQIHRNFPIKKEEASDSEEEKGTRQKKSSKKISKTSFESDVDEDDDLKEITKNDPFFNPVNDDEFSRSDVSSEEEEKIHYNPLEMLRNQQLKSESSEPDPNQKGMTKAKLEREANQMLQQSDVFKKMQRIKQRRSKKFRMFRLQPSESKEGPSKGGKVKKAKGLKGTSSVSDSKKGGGKKSKGNAKSASGSGRKRSVRK